MFLFRINIGLADKSKKLFQRTSYECAIFVEGNKLNKQPILVGFTDSDCSNTLSNVTQADFTIQTERRLVVDYAFPETHTIFKVCLKQKPRENKDGVEIDMPYILVS